ncbi:Ser/Thr protein kinase RdoA (MazF antagonist) [Arthrobacter sp. MP_2.3]
MLGETVARFFVPEACSGTTTGVGLASLLARSSVLRVKEEAEELAGGNASGSVLRVGDTVRKPWLENSAAVQKYLRVLQVAGLDVPKPLGRDHAGRHVTEYVEGVSALDQLPLGKHDLLRVGRLIRQIHDASEGFELPDTTGWNVLLPAENPNLMCHNDLAPWNFIMGERWVFIDWDAAGPSTRLWDLAYAAQSFGMLFEGQPVPEAAARLRAVVDGYGPDEILREALPEALGKRTAAMHGLLKSSHETGVQPWADMYVNGHGAHWHTAADYVLRNHDAWKQALT